ncbi:MAG: metal-dependent hydrolase [Pseudomonadota bacterium]
METTSQSLSPNPVVQRDVHFDLSGLTPATWHPYGTHVGHFMNALSIFFPEGEKFFINSVRHYQHKVTDPKLQDEVKGFIGQEAMHGREHRVYNAWLEQHGYPAARLERFVIKFLNFVTRTTTAGQRLGATIALEHLTAIMAESLLSKLDHFKGADPRIVALWRWHAIEETEHKAVAFDVYRAAFGSGLLAWLQRVIVFFVTSIEFWIMVGIYHWQLVKKDGIQWQLSGWWQLFKFLWITPGALRVTVLPWLAYFRPGFHPWDQDNRQHVEQWKLEQAAPG